MSSDPPHGGPSPADSSESPSELSLVALLRIRGAPLIDAFEAHDPGSRERADAAASYAFAAAVELGLTRPGAELIREVSKLREVGRVYVPKEVLARPAWSRTGKEAQVETHHELGAKLARGAGIPERVCEWIRLGAERYDGGGPHRLAGEAIPLQARISRAAYACYGAIKAASAERVRGAQARRGPADALRGSAGRELDPMVVDALETILIRARSG